MGAMVAPYRSGLLETVEPAVVLALPDWGSPPLTTLFLEPHSDDAVLFGCFSLLRHHPHVITVLSSQVQEDRGYGITQARREREQAAAMQLLGLDWEQWPYPDTFPDWEEITSRLSLLASRRKMISLVFAPAVEEGGHEHHNAVGRIADDVFGQDRVRYYATYTAGGKSRVGVEVPYEPAWVRVKLLALSCYRSQIESVSAGCTPHFVRGLDEWLLL